MYLERYLAGEHVQDWKELLQEVEAALARGEDPTGPKGRDLAQRWSNLVGGFTGGDPEIQGGLNRMYADQANWPSTAQNFFNDMPQLFNADVQSFIQKAMAALRQSGDRKTSTAKKRKPWLFV